MDYDTFMRIVQHDTGSLKRAERATQATLETLAERIAAGEAADLAEQLPPELAGWLETTTPAEGFDVDEFLRRVADREDVDVDTAERYVRAVFRALAQAVSPQEFEDMVAELSKDYTPLLPRGPHVEAVSAAGFLQRVADRSGVELEQARRITDAVLETLAERIAAGEVDDLIGRLPKELHEPLRRGRGRGGGKAIKMSLEEFEDRVAEREGVGLVQAEEHVRAVLVTLREAIGEEEFADVRVQLPREFDAVLTPA
jgi:uncharacterized protein (DUF2267 family)